MICNYISVSIRMRILHTIHLSIYIMSYPQMFEKKMNEFVLYPFSLALIMIICIWLLTVRLFSKGKANNFPPSPPKLPIIGNLHQVIGDLTHRSLASLSKKYGPLMYLQLGNKPVLVISSAAVVKEVTKTHDIPFSGRPELIATMKLLYGRKSLIASTYGDQWRMLRSIFVNHLLHKRMVKSFKSIRDEEISTLVKNIDKFCSTSAPVNLTTMFSWMANDMIGISALGRKYTKGEEGNMIMRIIEEATELILTFSVGDFIPWLSWMNRWNGYDDALDRVCKTKDELLEANIQEYDEETSSGGNNFAHILAGLCKGNTPGIPIDRDIVKAMIQEVIGAGTDTTTTALSWAMTELIRHPNIMKKLQEEVRQIMSGKQNTDEDDLMKMKYLKAVVKETLRLHPPIPILPRETNEDVQLMGYNIRSGTMVMLNLWAICRDPAHWDQPEKFLPERFLNSSIDYNGVDFQYIPFGIGRRICPGIYFATTTVEHVLANLIHKFDWQLASGGRGEDLDVIEKPGLVVKRKNPLTVVPTKRCY